MTKRRRRHPSIARPYTNLDDVPLVLRVPEMVRLYRKSGTTIRRQIRNGTFRPRPDGTNPYTWKKSTVLRDLDPPEHYDTRTLPLPLTH